MLNYENTAEIGDTIRAFDFQPIDGRLDHFVEGIVVMKGDMPGGYRGYTIKVTAASPADSPHEVGTGILVPFETTFDYEGRITVIKYAETPDGIFREAQAAAEKAVLENAHLENPNALDCGFAWVTVRPARGPFVTYLKKKITEVGDHSPMARRYGARNEYSGGWMFWQPGSDNFRGQSIAVFEAGAKAFASVLTNHGIKASVGSRLD